MDDLPLTQKDAFKEASKEGGRKAWEDLLETQKEASTEAGREEGRKA